MAQSHVADRDPKWNRSGRDPRGPEQGTATLGDVGRDARCAVAGWILDREVRAEAAGAALLGRTRPDADHDKHQADVVERPEHRRSCAERVVRDAEAEPHQTPRNRQQAEREHPEVGQDRPDVERAVARLARHLELARFAAAEDRPLDGARQREARHHVEELVHE
jgi:hypothetical protein